MARLFSSLAEKERNRGNENIDIRRTCTNCNLGFRLENRYQMNKKYCNACAKLRRKEAKNRYRLKNKSKLYKKCKDWEKSNPEKVKSTRDKSYKKNIERRREDARNYYQVNQEARRKYRTEYVLKNYEAVKKFKAEYSKNNRAKINDWQKKYNKLRLKTDPNYRICCYLRSRLNTVMRLYTSIGKIHSSRKYGIDYKKIIEHLKPFPEDMSKYHIDHIRPLVSFDLTDQEQVKQAFSPGNHQWLLAKENLSKGGKWNG